MRTSNCLIWTTDLQASVHGLQELGNTFQVASLVCQGYGQLPGHQTNVNQELLREQEPKVRRSAV